MVKQISEGLDMIPKIKKLALEALKNLKEKLIGGLMSISLKDLL